MGKKTLLSFDEIILTTKVFIFQELHLCFHIIDLCFKYPCYCIFHPTWLPPDNSIPLSYRLNDETVFGGNVDQSNTDFTDDITGRMDFFFQDCAQTPVYPQWWIFIGSPWGRRLPDTLWRTWFADNLVKTETAVLPWPVCFSVERHNVVGCPAAWKEKESNIYRSELILMLKECVMYHVSAFGSYSLVQVKEEKKILSISPAVNLCRVKCFYIKARGQGCNKQHTSVFFLLHFKS